MAGVWGVDGTGFRDWHGWLVASAGVTLATNLRRIRMEGFWKDWEGQGWDGHVICLVAMAPSHSERRSSSEAKEADLRSRKGFPPPGTVAHYLGKLTRFAPKAASPYEDTPLAFPEKNQPVISPYSANIDPFPS